MLSTPSCTIANKKISSNMIGRPCSVHQTNYVNVLFNSDRTVIDNSIKEETDKPTTGCCVKSDKIRSDSEPGSRKRNKSSAYIKLDIDKYLRPEYRARRQNAKQTIAKKKSKDFKADKSLVTDSEKPFKSKSAEDALQVIENRKKSIRMKLAMRKEHLLTQEEEQDIHTRADLYAITSDPDLNYCISVEKDSTRQTPGWYSNYRNEPFSPPRKKRRRNYGNTNCYVTQHNYDDVFDNTKMLPIGTRLVKPPTKLVELVAQAISGSPDGLLQVQQIYTFLQNKYPFFRYMDRVAINSWRSSVRHALYQKWFRKIRFDLSFISSKGCYWAINNKNNPKEWSLPPNKCITSVDKHICAQSLDVSAESSEFEEEADTVDISHQLVSSDSETDDCVPLVNVQHVDVENSDPVLNPADWTCEEMFLSSTESGHGTMSPDMSSPFQHYTSDVTNVKSEHSDIDDLLSTPIKYQVNLGDQSVCSTSQIKPADPPSQSVTRTAISPLVHWIPDWEQYGSYILSPQNVSMQRYILDLPNRVNRDTTRTESNDETSKCTNKNSNTDLGLIANGEDSPFKFCSDTSECSSIDYEIIAEFTKSTTESQDLFI